MVRCLVSFLFSIAAFTPAFGFDWPQWRGPGRDDVSKETELNTDWNKKSPKLLWTFRDAGMGYSGPAVVGNVLYLAGATKERETVFAIDVETGKELWRSEVAPYYDNNWGGGPRATPTIDGDHLYLLTGRGDLVCLDRNSGKKIWSKSLTKDLGGRLMSGWGYSESVLVDGDKLVCTPGGREGTIAALDKKTGALIWQSKEVTDDAAYSSIIAADFSGIRQYIQQTGRGVVGVSANDGRLLWYVTRSKYRTAVIPTPIFSDGMVYVTAGYSAGSTLIRLTPDGDKFKSDIVYEKEAIENHHGGVILIGGHIYGYSGRAGWMCQQLESGKVNWTFGKGRPGKGAVTSAAGHLFCYDESAGSLHCVEANPKIWIEKGSLSLPEKTKIRKPQGRIWTHPVIANGKLYLRDQDLVFCFDLRP